MKLEEYNTDTECGFGVKVEDSIYYIGDTSMKVYYLGTFWTRPSMNSPTYVHSIAVF